MDESITDMPEHHRIHYFTLESAYYDTHAEDLEATLQDLNDLFSSAGILLTADEGTLKIDVNEERFQSVTKRRAGRKKNDVGKRYQEIMEFRETFGGRVPSVDEFVKTMADIIVKKRD